MRLVFGVDNVLTTLPEKNETETLSFNPSLIFMFEHSPGMTARLKNHKLCTFEAVEVLYM